MINLSLVSPSFIYLFQALQCIPDRYLPTIRSYTSVYSWTFSYLDLTARVEVNPGIIFVCVDRFGVSCAMKQDERHPLPPRLITRNGAVSASLQPLCIDPLALYAKLCYLDVRSIVK